MLVGSSIYVCSSLLTMDGGRFKGCTEGGKFRLVISNKKGAASSVKTAAVGSKHLVLHMSSG